MHQSRSTRAKQPKKTQRKVHKAPVRVARRHNGMFSIQTKILGTQKKNAFIIYKL